MLPFALSNYVYGLSRCSFTDFIFATGLGFTPGTIGVVYAATAAKDAMSESSQPWYVGDLDREVDRLTPRFTLLVYL